MELPPHPSRPTATPAIFPDAAAQPHCADHPTFTPSCPTCARALAAHQPYPLKKSAAPARSFGYTDNLTEEKIRALDPKLSNLYADDPDFSLSLSILRFLRRLIWPF